MPVATLLPPNGTRFLRSYEQSVAPEPRVLAGINLIPNVKGRRLPSFLLFLLWEYGLIELVPFLPNPFILLDEGRQWQIERDTFAGVAHGLTWVTSPAAILEAPIRRQWWNNFQLYLEGLPPNDALALDGITKVTTLSKPFRSDFRRGVFGYDAPALELSFTRLSNSQLADDSGVRLKIGAPKWSFGLAYTGEHLLSEAEGTALGIWLPEGEGGIKWADLHIPWISAHFPWANTDVITRRRVMAAFFNLHRCHLAFKDAGGAVIGYRRARAMRAVEVTTGGQYSVGGVTYSPSGSGDRVIIEALTDAGDGAPETAASVTPIIDGVIAADIPPGRLWLEPNEFSGGVPIAATPLNIALRSTVRQRVTILVRF